MSERERERERERGSSDGLPKFALNFVLAVSLLRLPDFEKSLRKALLLLGKPEKEIFVYKNAI